MQATQQPVQAPAGTISGARSAAKTGGGFGVLLVQTAVSGLLIAAVLFCRYTAPKLFRTVGEMYSLYFEQEDLAPHLAKFAGSVLDYFSVSAYAEKAAPEGASSKAHHPTQKCVQPVEGYTVSSGYGWRTHPVTGQQTFHRGLDLACAEGTPVLAAMDGTVEYTLYSECGGNSVRVRHADGVETAYCHMQYLFVRAGETVAAGEIIGTAGSTGNATGPHLHFALLYNDIYYDPSEMLGLA